MSINKSVSLEDPYIIIDLCMIKREIAMLSSKQDYKTLNTHFWRNPNAIILDTKTQNKIYHKITRGSRIEMATMQTC